MNFNDAQYFYDNATPDEDEDKEQEWIEKWVDAKFYEINDAIKKLPDEINYAVISAINWEELGLALETQAKEELEALRECADIDGLELPY